MAKEKAILVRITEKDGHVIENTHYAKNEFKAVYYAAKTGKEQWDIKEIEAVKKPK